MIGVYSILLGAAIVVGALFLLRREFRQAYFIGPKVSDKDSTIGDKDAVLESIDKMEQGFMEMSEAFYDISGDLEGKYSVHEKELVLLEERIVSLEALVKAQEKIIKRLNNDLLRLSRVQEKSYIIEKEESKETKEIEEPTFNLEKRIEYRGKAMDEDVIKNGAEQVQMPHNEATDTKERIIALRSQGYSLKQIAKTLDIGLGEIQLILNMKRP